MQEMKKWIGDILKFVIFLGIGLFFVYWFLLKLDSETKAAIWNSIIGANYWWVAGAILLGILALFIRALRWQLLYEPLKQTPSINNTFGAVLVAYLANLAFPRLGEILRCAVIRTSENIPVEKSLGTVLTERIIDVAAYGVIALLGLALMFSDMQEWFADDFHNKFSALPSIAWIFAIAIGLVIIAIVLYKKFRTKLIKHKVFKKIDELLAGCVEGFKSIIHLKRRSMILFIIYSILIYLSYICGGWVIFQAFSETYGLGFKAAFVAYLFGSIGMVISQGGIGAYPTLVQKALALYGISLTVGNACGWLLWSSQQILIIILGLLYTIYFSLQKKKIKTQ